MGTTISTNLDMGGGAVSNLGAGTTDTDSVRFEQNKVVQIIQSTGTFAIDASPGATYTDTGLTVTITPTSSSNNILIILHVSICGMTNGGQTLNLLRGATSLSGASGNGIAYTSTSSNNEIAKALMYSYLDSPATTSATTYKIQYKGGNSEFGRSSVDSSASICTMLAIEVKP